jgi:hypothetical protein
LVGLIQPLVLLFALIGLENAYMSNVTARTRLTLGPYKCNFNTILQYYASVRGC